MYLRAGVFLLGLLLLSRVFGLLRESAQAAAFGSTGMGDAVIVMFTLPDLLVGLLVSGALSYVLLPVWAQQSPGLQAAGQKKIACVLMLVGLVLALPLVARSLASSAGEGALASFNYAWKLIELPLVLAVQLVASLAFPAITRTRSGTPEWQHAVGLAFLIAWALACAAVAVVATFSLPIASLLFGWGRMSVANLEVIAQWSAIGIWSLLPQALIAVLLTVMATNGRMHAAVWVVAVGLTILLVVGSLGGFNGNSVMWLLNAVFACMAVVLMALEHRSTREAFSDLAQIQWMPEPDGYHSTRWLTCIMLSGPDASQKCRQVMKALERHLIEARPVWKPMHLQPLFKDAPYFAHASSLDVSAHFFRAAICLPSGSNLSEAEQDRVIGHLRHALTMGEERHAFA